MELFPILSLTLHSEGTDPKSHNGGSVRPSDTALAPGLGWSLESIAASRSAGGRNPPDPLDPEARARRRGARATATPARSGGQPRTALSLSLTYISPLTRNPVLPREPSASVAGQKPGVLTFNRLDVAMFSTWTLARRGEIWRRSGPGLLERPGFPAGPRRPRRGMRGTPEERRAVSAELVPGSRASSGFPATWSPRPAHARERMQTLEETRAANGGKGRGADLTGKR